MKSVKLLFLSLFLLANIAVLAMAAAPNIKVTMLDQDPDPVEQGDIVRVRFQVQNQGGEAINNVEVEIVPKYPFTLYTGNPIKTINRLGIIQESGDSAVVDFKLKVDEYAADGSNEIELKVRAGGLEFPFTNNEFSIEINKYNYPNTEVYIKERTIIEKNSKGTITIEVANIDVADIKFLQFTLLPSNDYELLSPSGYVYMGDVDSDDTESEEFEIYVNHPESDEILIPISLEYQDGNEQKYEKQFDLTLKVYDSTELKKYGLKQTSNWTYFLILVILVVAGYWYWRRRKHKQQHKI